MNDQPKMFKNKLILNSKPNNPKLRTSPREVCDSNRKSSVQRNLGLTWDQTNFFASKILASGCKLETFRARVISQKLANSSARELFEYTSSTH
jgi:hypothetical protein